MKCYEIVAAIIVDDDKVLCMQRNSSKYDYMSFKYEFPGGKVEVDESRSSALMRELKEEMDLDLNVNEDDFFMTVKHKYPDFSITMHSFLCKVKEIQFSRKEHVNHCWMSLHELQELDWAEADIPIVKRLLNGGLKNER